MAEEYADQFRKRTPDWPKPSKKQILNAAKMAGFIGALLDMNVIPAGNVISGKEMLAEYNEFNKSQPQTPIPEKEGHWVPCAERVPIKDVRYRKIGTTEESFGNVFYHSVYSQYEWWSELPQTPLPPKETPIQEGDGGLL